MFLKNDEIISSYHRITVIKKIKRNRWLKEIHTYIQFNVDLEKLWPASKPQCFIFIIRQSKANMPFKYLWETTDLIYGTWRRQTSEIKYLLLNWLLTTTPCVCLVINTLNFPVFLTVNWFIFPIFNNVLSIDQNHHLWVNVKTYSVYSVQLWWVCILK